MVVSAQPKGGKQGQKGERQVQKCFFHLETSEQLLYLILERVCLCAGAMQLLYYMMRRITRVFHQKKEIC